VVLTGDGGTPSRIDGVPELVVIAEQLLAPVPGGTGRYTAELLRALATTAPEGWHVSSVVARRADVEAARIEGVRGPRRLPLPPRALVLAWQAGLPARAGGWPGGDAVHAPTPLAPPRAPTGRSLSVTVHDTVPWTHPATLTPRGVRWHRSAIARAAREADALVVPTAAVAADLGGRVAVRADVHVVGHGTTSALAEPAERPELPERYVLAIGTLEPRKGIDVLIEAMREVADVPLLLVGQQGWGGLDPRALAVEHGVDPARVRMLGRLPDRKLAAVLHGASVLAVPSLAEGFGLPLLEGMAAGVPVVHSDAPALVEVAGGAGITVPRGDAPALARAICTVLGDPEAARRMSARGERRATAFSWRAAAQQVWTIHAGP